MRRLAFILLMLTIAPLAGAQLVKPIDATKQADVNGRMVNPGNLNLREVTQPGRSFSQSPLSEKRQSFSPVELKNLSMQELQLAPYATEFVPQQNFHAKRAAIAEKSRKEKTIRSEKAPIKDRQIRPLTPAGEDELKKQLNEPR